MTVGSYNWLWLGSEERESWFVEGTIHWRDSFDPGSLFVSYASGFIPSKGERHLGALDPLWWDHLSPRCGSYSTSILMLCLVVTRNPEGFFPYFRCAVLWNFNFLETINEAYISIYYYEQGNQDPTIIDYLIVLRMMNLFSIEVKIKNDDGRLRFLQQ